MTRLSVILPLYNVSGTLFRALSGITCTTPHEIEVVAVDDGSTDDTRRLLDEYAGTCDWPIRVISQANQGAAAARNTALDMASGDYLLFLDADDRFAEGALDRILELTADGADIIGWDWMHEETHKTRAMRQADYKTPEEALRYLMGGMMKWNLWLFAVKRELVLRNGLRFTSGDDMGEDMAFMLKAFACAQSIRQEHMPLYRYNGANPASISGVMNERRRGEVSRNLDSARVFLSQSRYAALAEDYLPHLKLYIKRPLLISVSVEDYRTWFSWFPEANAFASANRELPLRIRLLQAAAAKKLWGIVKLYNWLLKLLK